MPGEGHGGEECVPPLPAPSFIHSFTADERASLQKPPQSLATIASEAVADLEFLLRLRNNFLLTLFCEV